MATVIQVACLQSNSALSASTFYLPLGETGFQGGGTEANAATRYRTAGTHSNLFARVIANFATGAGSVRTRKASANANLVVSITAFGTGIFEDTTNNDTVAAGDLWDYQLVTGSGGNTTYGIISSTFAATTGTVKKFAFGHENLLTGAATVYNPITGASGGTPTSSTESNTQWLCRLAGTAQNFAAVMRLNTVAAVSTIRFRKNSANGNGVISTVASTTGQYEDTSNTDSIASGDLLNWSVTTTTSGNLAANAMSFEFSTTGDFALAGTNAGGSVNVNANTSRYFTIGGDVQNSEQTTEAYTQLKTRVAFTAKNLLIRLATNTVSSASTCTVRKSAADTSIVASITGNTTGNFEDTSNTASILSTDSINARVTCGISGSVLSLRNLSLTSYTAPAGGSNGDFFRMMGV